MNGNRYAAPGAPVARSQDLRQGGALKAELDEYTGRADLEVLRAQAEVLVARELASYRLQLLGAQFASFIALALLILLRA